MKTLAVLTLAALPAAAVGLSESAAPARALVLEARTAASDSSDLALAALYQRLFALQDKRRDAELRIDSSELELGDIVALYRKFDRSMDLALLKEVAIDPEHPRYPGITEATALKLVESAKAKLRVEELAKLEISRLERDIKDTQAMIDRYLQRGGKP